jgi:hypothetical protein
MNGSQVSKLLQKYLGDVYDPERDWTSEFRIRSGSKALPSPAPTPAFILAEPNVREGMTTFLLEHGQFDATDWRGSIKRSPFVYHLEVAVGIGSKTSAFTLRTSQIERVSNYYRSLLTYC